MNHSRKPDLGPLRFDQDISQEIHNNQSNVLNEGSSSENSVHGEQKGVQGRRTEDKKTEEKPRKSVTVVCACILSHDRQRVLLSIRKAPGVPGLDGKWELPGGKIEFGETPEETIVREINEELSLKIKPRKLLPYLHTNMWEYSHVHQHVVLASYECELVGPTPTDLGADAKWFIPSEIDYSTTLPGTREFISLATSDKLEQIYIRFKHIDDTSKSSKQFILTTQPSFFDEFSLVKYWGTLDGHLRIKSEYHSSLRDLDESIFSSARSRLRQGYEIAEWQGPRGPLDVLTRIIELSEREGTVH